MDTLYPGIAFGAASTLVAQMGILLGMIVSKQTPLALIVASAASAISGSFGDAFSLYISESTANRESSAILSSIAVLFSKLLLGALYVGLFYLLQNSPNYAIGSASFLTISLLAILSKLATKNDPNKFWNIYSIYILLTVLVVATTSLFGYWIRSF